MDLPYRAVRALARFLLSVFYRRVEVDGAERIPLDGPLIVVANHPNGLVDPMIVIAKIPRRLAPIAKAPLFRNLLVAPFLRLAGAIPVQRRQDPGSRLSENRGMFEAANRALAAGRAILIFPEGVSQPEPRLMPLKSGAARIALAAGEGVRILPVGIVGHEPGTFRGGWALLSVGAPLGVVPGETADALTTRIEEALSARIVTAGDRRTVALAGVAASIGRGRPDPAEDDAAARASWMRSALRTVERLDAESPETARALRDEIEDYAECVERLGLGGAALPRRFRPGAVLRYAILEGGPVLLGLPLALLGLALHALPFLVNRLAIRLARPEEGMQATLKIAGGILFFPPAWALEGWLVQRSWGGAALAAFLILLIPSGFFALTWRERILRIRRDAAALATFLLRRDLYAGLASRRDRIRERIEALPRGGIR